MRLYDSPVSGNCYKVRLLLSQLGKSYEKVEVDVIARDGSREHLRGKNPNRRVPILELDDGRCIAESNAILWYLADGTEYLPSDPYERVRVLQWMFFEQNSHEPNIAVARYWVSILRKADSYREALEQKHKAGYAALSAMEYHLTEHPFFVGERYSIADISLFAYTHVAGEGGFDLERYPAVRAWLSRVEEQPGFIRMQD